MAAQLGGAVEPGRVREFGYAEVRARGHSTLLAGIEDRRNADGHGLLDVWMSHGDKVTALPPGFTTIAEQRRLRHRGDGRSDARASTPCSSIRRSRTRSRALPSWRVSRTTSAAAREDWNMANYVDEAVAAISRAGRDGRGDPGPVRRRRFVGGRGADPQGDRRPAHLRVRRPRAAAPGRGRRRCWTRSPAISACAWSTSMPRDEMYCGARRRAPIRSRSGAIIGRLFVDVFQRESARLAERGNAAQWLAQGTIYPDVIESAGAKTKKAHTIKSHHNVGGLPETLHLKLLEPLRELFKDEVRELGQALGLPREMVFRHPFPGPGLGVRILGAVTRHHADLLRSRRRHLHRRAATGARRERHVVVRPYRAGVRRVSARPFGGRDGRRPHVRARRRAARGADHRFHDGALGAAALRSAREGLEPDHQRSPRHQSRRVRHFGQAAGDDRMGVTREAGPSGGLRLRAPVLLLRGGCGSSRMAEEGEGGSNRTWWHRASRQRRRPTSTFRMPMTVTSVPIDWTTRASSVRARGSGWRRRHADGRQSRSPLPVRRVALAAVHDPRPSPSTAHRRADARVDARRWRKAFLTSRSTRPDAFCSARRTPPA